jgi:hypothetical protein
MRSFSSRTEIWEGMGGEYMLTRMPGKDPSHWLHRLSADEWLQAADNELRRTRVALEQRQHRAGIAGARRAAGMAWNGVLVAQGAADDSPYGRSYMDHLRALAADAAESTPLRDAAARLLSEPLESNLIPLGRGDTRAADAAEIVVADARRRVASS